MTDSTPANNSINYVEFPSVNIEVTKSFYSAVFGWEFQDYGPEYTAITNAYLDGGFFLSKTAGYDANPSPLIVLFHRDLESCIEKIKRKGGTITKEIFEFPGGKRFHFKDLSGNELAVWCTTA